MIPLPKDFREFIRLLNARRVKYLVVGGYAVAFHGHPRYTADIDFFVAADERNARALVHVLEDFGFAKGTIGTAQVLSPGAILRMGLEPLRLEILNQIDGVEFAECYARRVRAKVAGLQVNFIDLASLRKNKAASGRNKDLADLKQLPEAN